MSRLIRRSAPVAAVSALMLAFGAASAGAAVVVDDSTPSSTQTLTATVSSPPAGATQYTLAECNVSDPDPADWGRDCNAASAVGFTQVATTSRSIAVKDTFTNTSFVPGQSPQFGTTTDCDTFGLDPCAVVVSWYSGAFASLGAEKADLTF